MPAPESPPTTGLAPLAVKRADHRFSLRGWQVTVQLSGVLPDGCVEGHVDLRAHDYSCRLMLAHPRHDGPSAMNALAQKARAFISEQEGSSPAFPGQAVVGMKRATDSRR